MNKDLHEWLYRVGLPYHSPHKFRHGHATYALKRCRDVADLKAVSQNLMHSSLQVTDSIYSVLSTEHLGEQIAGLGEGKNLEAETDEEELVDLLETALRLIRQ